jgi:peptidoglycan/xylan/chitin deacetylase (PgdA/CDA1 family)
MGSNSGYHSFDHPPAPGHPVCPGTVLSILGDISDTDTWTGSREPCPKTLTVSVTANLSGPEGINETWPPAVGTASAPPSPVTASATLNENYTLCTPGEYTLTFTFTESQTPADDPDFPTPVEPFTFTVGAPDVSVTIGNVNCCPGCSYPLQINVTNSAACDAVYHWALTGNGPALNPTNPFTPPSDIVSVPAQTSVPIFASVNTDPAAADGATANIQITLTGPGDCPAEGASHTATVTVHRPQLTVAGVGENLEETLGAFVTLNVDDDDQNGDPDLGQPYVPGEDDLIAVNISAGGLPACGTLTLSVSAGVALWTTQEKGTPVTTLTWPAGSPPPTLWLEGTVASASPRNVELTLTYNGAACDPPACECSDTVLLTVIHADIIIDGPTIPGGGTLLGVGELAAMTLTQTPATSDCGDLALTWNDDPQTRKVRLYDSPEKTTEYTSALVWGAGTTPPPVYVEAVAPSDTLGDVVFTLSWVCDQTNLTTTTQSTQATVVSIVLLLYDDKMRINADFDKQLDGNLEDFRNPSVFCYADDDLLRGILWVKPAVPGSFWLTFDQDKTGVWVCQEGSACDGSNEHWHQMFSGIDHAVPLAHPGQDVSVAVEGLDGSQATNDASITPHFRTADGTEVDGAEAPLTVIKSEFMLTFDDGPYKHPWNPGTGDLLMDCPDHATMTILDGQPNGDDGLAHIYVNGSAVTAAFFMVGHDGSGRDQLFDPVSRTEGIDGFQTDWENVPIAQAVAGRNHSIGNHTNTHDCFLLHLLNLEDAAAEEIALCEGAIHQAGLSSSLFRLPYFGFYVGDGGRQVIHDLAVRMYYQVVWGSVYDDWKVSTSWQAVADEIISHMASWNTREDPVHNPYPNIVTLHDAGPPTARHLKEIVDKVRQAGFPLVNFDPGRAQDDRGVYKFE